MLGENFFKTRWEDEFQMAETFYFGRVTYGYENKGKKKSYFLFISTSFLETTLNKTRNSYLESKYNKNIT